ncbi:hypothetical protein EDB83DRAFT_2673960 [Lactarius deliciosus]|nr:hypothetical protein EDB83DRAFT_2673960 [Lactarius deliciosus]
MPSRSRRGGPGVGTSDVDTQILETLRRRRENDPLIPAPTQLLLTTDSTRVRTFGGGDAGSQQLNTSAYERYFDKPEVIRAYREQQLIQTPEYTLLSEHEAVGGRFRPRGQDDASTPPMWRTKNGHRKYETFEKRQRLREKEKLKHEQYKLKERIEQLRALEPSAVSPRRRLVLRELVVCTATAEWRKRQILDVANSLEARYRTLLDTAPSRAPELSTPTPAPATPAPVPPPKTATPVPAPNHTPAPTSPVVPRPQPVLPPPEPTEIIELDSDGEEQSPEPVKVEPALQPLATARLDPNETIRLRIKFPTRPPPPVLPSPIPSPVSAPAAVGAALGSPSPTRPRPKPIFKNPAAPGPYARVPFARRLSLQDGAANNDDDDGDRDGVASACETDPAISDAPDTQAPPRQGCRGASQASEPHCRNDDSLSTAPACATTSARARPETYDNNASAAGVGVGEEEEHEGPEPEEDGEDEDEEGDEEDDEDVPDGGGRRSGAREQRHERWRECALYREAQRHVGAPSARKTHRHLGIFGLRGFPADIEHMRDFVPPAAVPVVASMGVGAVGAGGTDKEAGQPVEMAVTVAEEVETLLEVGPDMSDPLTTVETPKTVDSQETEDLMLPLNC